MIVNGEFVFFIGAMAGVFATIISIKVTYGKWFWEIGSEAQ